MPERDERLPFIEPSNVPPKGKLEMKIVGNTRTYQSNWGLKINMDVRVNNKDYTFGIKPENPGLRIIIDSLAQGRKIEIERGSYKGNEFVQIVGAKREDF